MKKFAIILGLMLIAGCSNSPKFHPDFMLKIKANHQLNQEYLDQAKGLETSRGQDLNIIQANAEAWKVLYEWMETAQ